MKRTTDSPAWRHIQMLSMLTSKDGNTPLIKGWDDGREYPTAEQMAELQKRADKTDLAKMAASQGVARYISDKPVDVLKMGRYGVSFNLDGIWGGNMYAGGAGAILPNRIVSKHAFRYVPKMDGLHIVQMLREQIDRNGYPDVQMKLIGDVPWSRGSSPDADISVAHRKAAAMMGLGGGGDAQFMANADHYDENGLIKPLGVNQEEPTGGYWPSYLFSDGEVGQKVGSVSIPMGMGARGGRGGRAHAANEYYEVEGARWDQGMAGAEKIVAAVIWEYSQTTTTPPKPKTHVAQ
jgi:acetylornithine deacetylase/succinyl-diaminopimelate desuccinylase-like protein